LYNYIVESIYIFFLGPKTKRDRRATEIRDIENNPENQFAEARWAQVTKSRKEARFSDGPVFKKITQPKQTFFQKHYQKVTGFLLVGSAFFYTAVPLYGLFIQPLLPTQLPWSEKKEKLGTSDPQVVLRNCIQEEYFMEHGVPWKAHYDKEDPRTH
jgi:hypothetical protein